MYQKHRDPYNWPSFHITQLSLVLYALCLLYVSKDKLKIWHMNNHISIWRLDLSWETLCSGLSQYGLTGGHKEDYISSRARQGSTEKSCCYLIEIRGRYQLKFISQVVWEDLLLVLQISKAEWQVALVIKCDQECLAFPSSASTTMSPSCRVRGVSSSYTWLHQLLSSLTFKSHSDVTHHDEVLEVGWQTHSSESVWNWGGD